MNPERFERSAAMIAENLKLLDNEASSAAERRIAQLSELATLISQEPDILLDTDSREEDFSSLFVRGAIPEASVEEARPYLEAYYSSQLLSDKLAVCRFLADSAGRAISDSLRCSASRTALLRSKRIRGSHILKTPIPTMPF